MVRAMMGIVVGLFMFYKKYSKFHKYLFILCSTAADGSTNQQS